MNVKHKNFEEFPTSAKSYSGIKFEMRLGPKAPVARSIFHAYGDSKDFVVTFSDVRLPDLKFRGPELTIEILNEHAAQYGVTDILGMWMNVTRYDIPPTVFSVLPEFNKPSRAIDPPERGWIQRFLKPEEVYGGF